ncbi:MAG: NAD(P)/FAD-dependent oxidoreductase [bacterium]
MGNEHNDVVIVGAGFGGITLAQDLAGEDLSIRLVDRHNYHTFQPLLYQVATAGLDPEQVAHSVRDIFQKQENFTFQKDTVHDIDFGDKQVLVEDDGRIDYDYLVLAAGASANYFGVEGAKEHSIPVKNLSNAVHLRSHILEQFEKAQKHPELIDQGILNFVVVGGGPTGVETSGALMELFDHVLRWDFSEELVEEAQVILLEMMPNLLSPYQNHLQSYTKDALEKRGVDVKLETTVNEVTETSVHLQDDGTIMTQTLIWAAGVKANPLADHLAVEQTRGGRIVVDRDLSLPTLQDVFVIGDMAGATDPDGELYPQLAPVAIQSGHHAADQIQKLEASEDTEAFVYDDPGQMATIGRHDAVVEFAGGYSLKGYFAWVIWVFLHIAKLIGFRHKIMVFLSWVYNYFTYGASSRLILPMEQESDDVERSQQDQADTFQD